MNDAALARRNRLAALRIEALACDHCPLASPITQVVFGDGDPEADLILVGEAPGAEENAKGRPFLGAAGKNLEQFLSEIGLRRSDVYIANVVMRRPPDNRPPRAGEVEACASYLDAQIELIAPRVVIALGARPTKRLLGRHATVADARRRVHQVGDVAVVSTYHPSPLSINRVPERRAWIQADFRRAKDLSDGRIEGVDPRPVV